MAAVEDLRMACKLDFDEQTDEWLKEVLPNVSLAGCVGVRESCGARREWNLYLDVYRDS